MAYTIVVGYDGSEGAKAALRTASEIARTGSLSMHVVFCYEPPAAYAGAAGTQRDAIESVGRTFLDEAQAQLTKSDVDGNCELVGGRPLDGLMAAADKYDAAMIVIGHHGEGPIKGAILGSTAHKLLHHSSRPILVVPATEGTEPA